MDRAVFVIGIVILTLWFLFSLALFIAAIVFKKDSLFSFSATLAGGFFVSALKFLQSFRTYKKNGTKIIVPKDKDG